MMTAEANPTETKNGGEQPSRTSIIPPSTGQANVTEMGWAVGAATLALQVLV